VKSIIRPSLHVALIAGALASIAPDRAGAAEITFLCAAAIESWMHDVIPQFEKASGHTVKPNDPKPTWGTHSSFNYLVGLGEQRGRDREAQRLCGLEVDHQLELGGLLDWKVSWLRTL
jgi:hypothetical protein